MSYDLLSIQTSVVCPDAKTGDCSAAEKKLSVNG